MRGPGVPGATKPPVVSVALISASALAYEILLMRLFSIVQWHHFAYMIISLALLGYGISGTFVTLTRGWILPRFNTAYLLNGAGFAITSVGGFLAVQQLPFNPLEILWDPNQWTYLMAAYLILLLPFFFAANCIVLAFGSFDSQIPRIYGFDLLGAGLGSLGVIALLSLMEPQQALLAVGIFGLSAVAVAAFEGHTPHRWPIIAGTAVVIGFGLLLPADWLSLRISPYKPLSQALQVAGTRVDRAISSPRGQITILENPQIPFRLAAGVSLNNLVEPPTQFAMFVDGGAPSAITRYDGDDSKLAYLDYQTSAVPFHLRKARQVLILGLGGGSGILQAAYRDVDHIRAVELNPQIVDLLQDEYAEFAGWRHLSNPVQIHSGEARGFLSQDRGDYDVIQMSLLDAAGASNAGLYALNENYLYTREGLGLFFRHLKPGGLLSITRWAKVPPRDGLKLFATSVEMLDAEGVLDPDRQLAMIRGWQTSTLLVRRGAFEPAEIDALKRFCRARSFDLVWYPGIEESETNRYNVLERPYFHLGAKALLGADRDAYISEYKFSIEPATDDRPYFFNFFKWKSLREILSLQQQAGFPLVELGYLVLIITLAQALVVSLLLILLPLLVRSRERETAGAAFTGGVLTYFIAIGLAFLFIEIAFIQRFIGFLADPIHTVAVVLFSFLLFSGLGSFGSRYVARRFGTNAVVIAAAGIACLTLLSTWLHPVIFSALVTQTLALKVVISVLLIAPLAFFMGMPFPIALAGIPTRAAWLLPWAWGVNGFASLISAIVATLMAVHFGFSTVLIAAVGLYVGAALIHRGTLSKNGVS